ncbi:MAG: MotA/TolQ/ExbB proton channel family protein [Robiginitomaculum sp.]|nr:MotA/TolQ/ExbB proton channel family protein [Robiginitomaculum sp.]
MPEWLNPKLAYEGLQDFLGMGGNVLVVIMFATFVMWTFIMERYSYYYFAHNAIKKRLTSEWESRTNTRSWRSRAIRDDLISQVKAKTDQNIGIIKTLVAIAPLLGLLGTVTGMIDVFDVMALSGSSNARLMAGGVFKATIPTMAGMVSALSGLFFSSQLDRRSKRETAQFADTLLIGEA